MLRAGHLLHTPSVSSKGQGARYYGNPLHFIGYGLAAYWDTSKPATKTFNGNDISALASVVPGGINPAQATGANQPLGIGSPQYGEFVSIQFTAANADRLQFAANIIGAVPASMFGVWKARNVAAAQFILGNCAAGGAAGWSLGVRAGATGRDTVAAGVAARTDGVPDTTVPETWYCRDWAAASPTADMMIGGTQRAVAGGAAVRTTPGAGGQVVIGSLEGATLPADVDFCCGGIFTTATPDSVGIRISHCLGPRARVLG